MQSITFSKLLVQFWKLLVQLYSLWYCLRRTVKFKGSLGTPSSFTLCKGVKSLLLKAWNPGGGNGYLVQYSGLENFMDRGAWWATIHEVTKIRTWLINTHTHTHTHTHTVMKTLHLQVLSHHSSSPPPLNGSALLSLSLLCGLWR